MWVESMVRTVGLIGGLGWQSTAEYYERINREVEYNSKGKNAKILLFSLDFSHILSLEQKGRWDDVGDIIKDAGIRLQGAGAEALVICSNSAHKAAGPLEESADIPLIHVVDATARALKEKGLRTIGLLGTKFILKDPFYAEKLRSMGYESILPDLPDIEKLNKIIYRELARGKIKKDSSAYAYGLAEELVGKGAQGIVLGCTELPLIITAPHVSVPLVNTMDTHVDAICDFILG